MSQTVQLLFRVLCTLGPISLLAGCSVTPAPQPPSRAAAAAPPAATGPVALQAPARPLQNTIRWKTASEVENFGFDVYRGPSEEGPFEKITTSPVPGAGTVDEPRSYQYSDEKIEAGVTYWYYVESISTQGVREKFTPTFKAPVKTAVPAPVPDIPPVPR